MRKKAGIYSESKKRQGEYTSILCHNLVALNNKSLPWVPEVLFFLREKRAVKTERRKIKEPSKWLGIL